MKLDPHHSCGAPALRDLYPSFTDEQLAKAEENLRLHLELALRMYERIRNDPSEYQKLRALTESSVDSNIEDQRAEEKPLPATS